MKTARQPALFLSHGSPTLPLERSAAVDFLRQLGPMLDRPEAILMVSAHWDTDRPAVSTAEKPETIYDFYGFPPELYRLRYPAPGAPKLAKRAAALLEAGGLRTDLDPGRGLDHGAWTSLLLMYPKADIPVTQLSIQSQFGPGHHVRLGEALRPLRRLAREMNVAVLGALHPNKGQRGSFRDLVSAMFAALAAPTTACASSARSSYGLPFRSLCM